VTAAATATSAFTLSFQEFRRQNPLQILVVGHFLFWLED
jgi:hypothetical protein